MLIWSHRSTINNVAVRKQTSQELQILFLGVFKSQFYQSCLNRNIQTSKGFAGTIRFLFSKSSQLMSLLLITITITMYCLLAELCHQKSNVLKVPSSQDHTGRIKSKGQVHLFNCSEERKIEMKLGIWEIWHLKGIQIALLWLRSCRRGWGHDIFVYKYM